MRSAILDTGPLVAAFNPRDEHHAWALDQSRSLAAPLVSCEAVLTEAFHLLRKVPGAPATLRKWILRGRVTTPLRLEEQAREVMNLMDKYEDQPMDFADACVVRLAEMWDLPVFTLDVRDFSVYRIHGREEIPVIIPK